MTISRARWFDSLWYEYLEGRIRRWPPWQKPPRGALLNRAHPMARGLIAGFSLNDYAGSIFVNGIGKGYALPASGMSWDGAGLYVDGTSDIDIGTDLASPSQGTIICRVKPDFDWDTPGAGYDLLGSTGAGGVFWVGYTSYSPEEWNVSYRGSFGDYVYCYSNEGYSSNAQLQVWHDLAFYWDITSGGGVYVNSSLSQHTAGTTNAFATHSWEFNAYDGGSRFKGWIEYLYMYDRILTQAEITQFHREPYGMFL